MGSPCAGAPQGRGRARGDTRAPNSPVHAHPRYLSLSLSLPLSLSLSLPHPIARHHAVVVRRHAQVVEQLLAASADPSLRDATGDAALDRAVRNGHADVAAALTEQGSAAWDLHAAAALGRADELEALLGGGGGGGGGGGASSGGGRAVDAADGAGMTPLMKAAAAGEAAAVAVLVGKGATLEATDAAGGTALLWAADNGRAEVQHRMVNGGGICGHHLLLSSMVNVGGIFMWPPSAPQAAASAGLWWPPCPPKLTASRRV